MPKAREAFRTISEVSAWLDTPAHVLRFWESKFTQIRPVKRAGGRRYYRPEDMALLGGIKMLLHEQGMTIKGVQKMLRERGVRHVAGLCPLPPPDGGEILDLTGEEETIAAAVAEPLPRVRAAGAVPVARAQAARGQAEASAQGQAEASARGQAEASGQGQSKASAQAQEVAPPPIGAGPAEEAPAAPAPAPAPVGTAAAAAAQARPLPPAAGAVRSALPVALPVAGLRAALRAQARAGDRRRNAARAGRIAALLARLDSVMGRMAQD
jgi:DNA-binding transcriptional MerR regulator